MVVVHYIPDGNGLAKWGEDGYTGWNVTSDSVGDGD